MQGPAGYAAIQSQPDAQIENGVVPGAVLSGIPAPIGTSQRAAFEVPMSSCAGVFPCAPGVNCGRGNVPVNAI